MREQDQVLLSDFGNATYLGTMESLNTYMIKGTAEYMSPEQFHGKICRQSDQYALGCIAYELFTGQRPFTASDLNTWKQKHETEPPRPMREIIPELAANIESATLIALAKEPSQRYTNVATFVQQLRATTGSAGILIPNPAPPHSPQVKTVPPIIDDATIGTPTPPVVQQSDTAINEVAAPTISTPQGQPQDRPPSLHELPIGEPLYWLP